MDQERKDIPKPFDFEQLRFKRVEVSANGITYSGVLIGADDEDIYLKGTSSWIILPMSRVRGVRLAGQGPSLDARKHVGADFYSEKLDEDES